MTDFISGRTGRVMRPRDNQSNPHYPTCAAHLRRCCGVCVHFEGDIIRTTARCTLLGGLRSGLRNAGDCQFWGRKSAGVDA